MPLSKPEKIASILDAPEAADWIKTESGDSIQTVLDRTLIVNVPLLAGSGNASANQTLLSSVAAILTAAGGGIAQLPAGTFYHTGVVTFYTGNLTIRGMGRGTTTLQPLSTTSGSIKVRPTSNTPTDTIQRVNIKGMTIFCGVADPTSAVMVTLERCRLIDIAIEVGGGWGGLDIASCIGGTVDLLGYANGNFTSAKAGSFITRWRQISGSFLPAEIHVRGNEVRGNGTNDYLEFCHLIQAADGLFFEPFHGGFAKHCMALIPETSTTQLTGIKAEFWTDSTTVSGFVCRYDAGGTYGGQFGLHRIVLTNGYDTPKVVHVNILSSVSANNLPSQIVPGQFHRTTDRAIHFEKGLNWALLPGGDIEDGVIGVQIGATFSDLILHPGRIRQGQGAPLFSEGISIVNGATDFRILAGWEFEGCTLDIADNSTTNDKSIGMITTDKGLQTIDANGSGALFIPPGAGAVIVGTANNVGIISSSAGENELLHLRFAGTVSVFDTNNLKLSAAFNATADDWLMLMQQGGNYYEVSRSAN